MIGKICVPKGVHDTCLPRRHKQATPPSATIAFSSRLRALLSAAERAAGSLSLVRSRSCMLTIKRRKREANVRNQPAPPSLAFSSSSAVGGGPPPSTTTTYVRDATNELCMLRTSSHSCVRCARPCMQYYGVVVLCMLLSSTPSSTTYVRST